MTIDNSKSSSISTKWKNPGAKFYDKLIEDSNYKSLLKEAYLITNDLNKDIPFSRSGCKYPHHSINGDKLIVNKNGVMAAYKRAKQQGIFHGKVKNHLLKHFRELEIEVKITESGDIFIGDEITIEENFNDIYLHIMESTGINLFPEDTMMLEAYDIDNDPSADIENMKPLGFRSSKDNEEYVPIFGVTRAISDSEYRADGVKKSESEMGSTRFKHQVKAISRGDIYSHAVVAFDYDLEQMYSYNVKEGFVTDSIRTNVWLCAESLYICVMFVTKEDKERMQNYVNYLIQHKDETDYAYVNFLRAYVGKPVKGNMRYICSTFVAYILQCSNPKNLHRDYSRQRPEDITILPRTFYVMNVTDGLDFQKRKEEFKSRVKAIYNQHIDEIRDYNNELPKLMLKDRVDKLKTLDKILEWLVGKK